MRERLPGPVGSGSSTQLPREAHMDHPATRVTVLTLLGLLTATSPLVPVNACADTGATDRHEIPAFVRGRTELVTDAAKSAFPTPRSAPDGPADRAEQALGPTDTTPAGPH